MTAELIAPTGVTEKHRERFMANVVELPSGCWEWRGRVNPKGYGVLYLNGRSVLAHRVSFELDGGDAEGLPLDHTCHSPALCEAVTANECRHRRCVNPAHLEPVTHRENTLRSGALAAVRAQQTECIHGHPFDLLNTYSRDDRPYTRECKTCRADAVRRYRERKRADA